MKILRRVVWRVRVPLAAWKSGGQDIAMEDGTKKDRDQKKDANTCEDSLCRRECLWNRYNIRRKTVNRERHLNTYKADSLAKHGRGDTEDIHRRNKPLFCEPDIGILGLRKLCDLLSKDGEDRIARSAGIKPGIYWMGPEVLFGALLVSVEGAIEDDIKVVGKGSLRG